MRRIEKQKIFAALLILGAAVLLSRTMLLLFREDGIVILALWVIILTFTETAIDILCIVFSFRWLIKTESKPDQGRALRFGASAAFFHAFRVFIYVLGRLGPLAGFDLKPSYRSYTESDPFWLVFAGVLSLLGISGVIIISLIRKKMRDKQKIQEKE